MTYAMADIHGCYDMYMKMLEKINFSDSDTLYVVGDVLDRGAQPLEVLRDMSMRANVIPIMGNHEFVAHHLLSRILVQEITEENINELLGSETDVAAFLQDIEAWTNDGGGVTMQAFAKLPRDESAFLLEYLEEFALYERVIVAGRKFILTHAGLPSGATWNNLPSFTARSFITAKTDYSRQYFDDIFLVTGHRPTLTIDEAYRKKIYRKNNHIAIDTGAVFSTRSGVLACICLDTFEEFYV